MTIEAGFCCNPEQTTVVLLQGGNSGEREISLLSGAGSAKALEQEGFRVVLVDPAQEDFREQIIAAKPDVAFICLHGKGGEDGWIQGELEKLKVPYTGSGVEASALAIDKAAAKEVYVRAGIPTPEVLVVTRADENPLTKAMETIGCEVAVKPATEGSALGVHLVHEKEGLTAALKDALALDEKVLIERLVEGTEVTVAVLGNDELEVLPIIEIVPVASDFYDFEAKYAAGGSNHIVPARIDEEQAQKCRAYALAAHKALGCRGVSRSDMIIDADGQPWVLETNTVPGMTATSLLPDAAQHVGYEFGALCKLLIDLALADARH